MSLNSHRRSVGAAIALFFVAPLVAEFLLGNLPITLLPALVMLAPMYGGGALLIREVVRRSGRGWPSIVLLALAYGILEEAFTTQSLFNPNYLLLNLHLLRPGYIAALGMGGWWTVFVLTLHTAWSISTPIALLEAAVPNRAETPWLGNIGLSVTALLFVGGIVGTTAMTLHQDRFISRPAQFAVAAVVMLVLIVAAFMLPRKTSASGSGFIPNPWIAGALGLIAASGVLLVPPKWGELAGIAVLAIDLAMLALIVIWGHRAGWTLLHKMALAGGAALA